MRAGVKTQFFPVPFPAPLTGGDFRSALELCPGLDYFSHMFIVHVHVQVQPEHLAAFQAATLANARASVQEPGILRFDVVQQTDDPARFTLVEVYHDEAANAAHRETPHYLVWRDTVANMMAVPRTRVVYHELFPEATGWKG